MSKFVWFEYVTTDTNKAKGFFGELFGWTTQEIPAPGLGTYSMIASGTRTIGGYLPTPEGAPKQAHWITHLEVASAADTAKQVESLGGQILKQPIKMSEFGTMAVVRDPQGAVLALWQPGKSEEQPAPTANTFCWNELASQDPEASAKFYAAIGSFTTEKMEMPNMGAYHVLHADGKPRAGIMGKMMPQQPTAWLPYVQVASTDKTVEKAKKLGGNVIVPPTDIPNVGRFAIVADTQGAPLGILQP